MFYLLTLKREEGGGDREGRGREGEIEIHCSIYLCIHWLLLVCALTRDQTCNLGISQRPSNQLSYLARA